MSPRSWMIPAAIAALAVIAACTNKPAQNPTPVASTASATPPPPAPTGETTEVLLCDGKTKVTVPTGTPGTAIAGSLMTAWLAKHPGSNWEGEEREKHALQPADDNAGLVDPKTGAPQEGNTYQRVTAQDVALWKTETERVALAGSMVFHDAEQLGSTVGVSCDMCHPHAANTHPETYPKFQPQLGRVALLRDMINWCIEHPVRGKPMSADDPRMRALEAYIYAQRKGKVLDYGKR